MGLPTFVPDTPMYTFSRGTNSQERWEVTAWQVPRHIYPYSYSDWDNLESRVYWWHLTDFKALPGAQLFTSVPELFERLLVQTELFAISAELRRSNILRTASASKL